MSVFQAAAEGDLAALEKVLNKSSASVKDKDERGWTVSCLPSEEKLPTFLGTSTKYFAHSDFSVSLYDIP